MDADANASGARVFAYGTAADEAREGLPACLAGFMRLCADGFAQGWHEANGGNLSYRMTPGDVDDFAPAFLPEGARGPWRPIATRGVTYALPRLAGSHLIVTGSGRFLRNVPTDPSANAGVIQIDPAGAAWRLVWGLVGGGSPSSELVTHLRAYDARLAAGDDCRVVYHAHCPNVVALSTLIRPDARTWTRMLWRSMTECVIVFPEGLGVAPWMVPGSPELADATRDLLRTHRVVVWSLHGIIAVGTSFDEAFGAVHTVEKTAGLYLAARAANGGAEPPRMVTDAQLRAVCDRYALTINEDMLDDGRLATR